MGFWDEEFAHDRVDIVAKLGMNFLIICVCFILVLAVYWGSFYGKPLRYKNLEFLVAIDETEILGVAPLLSQTIQLVINSAAGREYGDWQVMNSTVLRSFADAHNNTVREEVDRLIHHQKYWGAIYVHANATYDYATAFRTSNTSFTPVNTLVEFVYESARDISISSYLKPIFSEIDAIYQAELYRSFFPAFFEVVGQKQLQSLLLDPALLTAVPAVNYRDNIPIPDYIFMAPLQIGLVYMIVFSFFQFLNFVKLHTWVSTRVFGIRYIIYRMTISHGSYVVVALAYAVLNVAFQIDYKQTFGKSGFLVLWAFAYLMMASLGGLNELVFLYILTFFPPLIGFWLLATIAINLAPTLNPIPLCSRFYQYGYAVPVWNAHQIMGVLFFNTWKGKLGREIGVLLAWTVITTAAVPFAMIHTSKIRARQEARAKERAAEEAISVK
ncbi:hypothetical protein BABINDRAFT_34800 [Babjeviella inositovora NRRL Y-12698]|uniref:DUF3533 domain-containing protein n=1 Tax=Babjeviella inositovora NRRL Y-12698 TaxID=984486 RepID=A0A1E3QSS0_9ASCO|nr:uncharacterized protein BABINDRAFT_34800 [Babjeviella inositovora NRRL Y-12698]ODQ80739.1 hypothetical protein BABINDRAFT_34800 [Babjeviella inositovora NRRL Y-12698]